MEKVSRPIAIRCVRPDGEGHGFRNRAAQYSVEEKRSSPGQDGRRHRKDDRCHRRAWTPGIFATDEWESCYKIPNYATVVFPRGNDKVEATPWKETVVAVYVIAIQGF